MSEAWVPISRTFFEREDWLAPSRQSPACNGRAWLELIHLAQVRPYTHAGERLQAGEFMIAVRTLGMRLGWSKSRAARFLTRLELDGMIWTVRGTPRGTVYRLENWRKYRPNGEEDGHGGTDGGTAAGTGAGQERDRSGTRTRREKKEVTTPYPYRASSKSKFPETPPSLPLVTMERADAKGVDLPLEWEAFVGHYSGEIGGAENIRGKWTKWVTRSIRDAQTRGASRSSSGSKYD